MSKPDLDLFIKEYVLSGLKNAKQAAIKAGYSEKTADQQASRLLKNVKVKEAIDAHQKKKDAEFIWSKERKLKILQDTIENCANLNDEQKMNNPASLIAAIKEHNLMQGDNAPTETNANITVSETLASKLTGGSKR